MLVEVPIASLILAPSLNKNMHFSLNTIKYCQYEMSYMNNSPCIKAKEKTLYYWLFSL